MKLIDAHTHRVPHDPEQTALVDLPPGNPSSDPDEGCFYSSGIHPRDLGRFSMDELVETLCRIPCAAVGECGLDSSLTASLEEQEKSFRAQIVLSEELNLPLVVHCVRQYYELIRIRKELVPRQEWLIHGFRGKSEVGQSLLGHGMILSLSPVWLLHQDRFPEWLPADAFLLETDESALPLRDIYSHAAKLRGETMEDLAGILQKTFDRWLFR